MEDPGSVNFLAELPSFLQKQNWRCVIIADGLARKVLAKRHIPFLSREQVLSANAALQDFKPSIVITGTSENKQSFAFDLIDESMRNSIPTIGAVDMAVNAEYRFRGQTNNPLNHCPDYIVVPDEMTVLTFRKLGFAQEKLVEIGHPHYDYVKDCANIFSQLNKKDLRAKYFPTFKSDDFIVTFLSQPSSLLDKSMMERSEEYTLVGWRDSNKRTNIVLQEIIDALEDYRPGIKFGVRLHPKNSLTEFIEVESRLDFLDTSSDSLEFIYATDFVIGMSTMLLFEAALMGKQTLSVLPRKTEFNWMPSGAASVIPVAYTKEQIKLEIDAVLTTRSTLFADCSFSYKSGALKRLADFVVSKLGSS